jgi:hypothetical protein
VSGPAVDSAACPVDGPVDGPAGGPASARWRGEPLLESRAYLELARLLADPVWRGHGVPAGDSGTVLLLPGYPAGDNTLSLLARFLRRIGHRPAFAGIAFNSGCARSYAGRMADALRHQRVRTGREVAIVGQPGRPLRQGPRNRTPRGRSRTWCAWAAGWRERSTPSRRPG